MEQEASVTAGFDSHNQQQELDSVLLTTDYSLPTLSEIKTKIPSHYFRSTVRKSVSYLLLDMLFIALAYTLMLQVERIFKYGYVVYPLYWYVQGTLYMSLFSLGHDCTHGSFSVYSLLNNGVGTLVFTWILIPYYPWKITHRNHHKNTGNMDKDEAFYPIRGEIYEESLIVNILFWVPGVFWFNYLVFGYWPRKKSHFNPFDSIYNKNLIAVSLSLGVYAGMCYLMFIYAIHMGVVSLIAHHLIPVFVFATYLFIVTLLHHTEMKVPWFVDSKWSHVKGQLSTVDRHYGPVHSIIHSIGTHQIHHLFPQIPHYHLDEATAHFRKAFPKLVRFNHDRILPSYARMWKKFILQRNIEKHVSIFTYSEE